MSRLMTDCGWWAVGWWMVDGVKVVGGWGVVEVGRRMVDGVWWERGWLPMRKSRTQLR